MNEFEYGSLTEEEYEILWKYAHGELEQMYDTSKSIQVRKSSDRNVLSLMDIVNKP